MSEKPKKPGWYTIREAADYLNVGEPTIYRWMRDQKLTYRKVGDSTRFLQQDLDEMVQVFPSNKTGKSGFLQRCMICASEDLVDGHLQSTGRIYFRPDETPFWTLKDANIKTTGKICSRCGHINWFGDVSKLALLRKEEKPQSGDDNNE